MTLIILLLTSMLGVAISSEFFSIYGLAHIYSASSTSIIIMGAALGFAKLIAISFLYRYRNTIGVMLKAYLTFAIIILMSITSIGVFGYLSAGYQEGNIPMSQIDNKISTAQDQLTRKINNKNIVQGRIDEIPVDKVISRKTMILANAGELKQLSSDITLLENNLNDLKHQKSLIEAHVGPIMYVAKVLNANPDNVLFYLTMLIVVVFDPLAVALTIATNVAILQYQNKKTSVVAPPIEQDMLPPVREVIPSPITENIPQSPKQNIDPMDQIREEVAKIINR